MKILTIFLTFLFGWQAQAEEPIHFVAEVADEALAEDAILLAHCLGSRSGQGWELGSEARGPYSLKITENGGNLTALYHAGTGGEKTAQFGRGESDKACDTLEPLSSSTPSTAAPRPLAALAPHPLLTGMPPGDLMAAADNSSKSGSYLWIGGGIAILAGGYLLLHARSHRADFNSLQMN